MPQLTDQLWELHYDLLSETEAERLRVRIDKEPAVAKEYDEVKRSASQIAQAARRIPTRPLAFVVPPDGRYARHSGNGVRENTDFEGEKRTVCPPPDLPEEITGSFPVVLDSISGSSVRHVPPKVVEKSDFVRKTVIASSPASRTIWSPFSGRFSSKYLRSNRVLTVCSLLFLALTILGFLRIRQTQSLIADKLLQIHVAAPSVLARATQNTISVDVSDLAGNPKQLPVRVRLLSELGEKIATYQEKTDSDGDLRLSLENPSNLPENVYLEITAGESGAARSVRRSIPVVDPPSAPKFPPTEVAALAAVEHSAVDHSAEEDSPAALMRLMKESENHPSVPGRRVPPPYYSNSQNAMAPAMRGQKNGLGVENGGMGMSGGGMGGMSGGMGAGKDAVGDKNSFSVPNENVPMEKAKPPQSVALAFEEKKAAPATLPAVGSAQLRTPSELPTLPSQERASESPRDASESLSSSLQVAQPSDQTAISLTADREQFDTTQPIRFQVRSHQSEQALIASISRAGIPLAQIAIKTSQMPEAPKTITVPENDSQIGLMQISLFDPTTNPPKEVASCSVFRHGNRTLKVAAVDPVESAAEVPTALKITDETGKPVAATVRVSWGKGTLPPSEAVPAPTLIENKNQIREELETSLAQRKPVFTEMLDFFTILATVGGVVVSLITVLLFLLRMVSGYVPLTVATITGILCVLFGVSMMHDLRATQLGEYLEKPVAQVNSLTTTPEKPPSEAHESFLQWTTASDSDGICRLQFPERIEGRSTFLVEAFGPEERIGFARWELK